MHSPDLTKEEQDRRSILLLANFAENHSPKRVQALETFSGQYEKTEMGGDITDYWKDLARSKYVLSPPGGLFV